MYIKCNFNKIDLPATVQFTSHLPKLQLYKTYNAKWREMIPMATMINLLVYNYSTNYNTDVYIYICDPQNDDFPICDTIKCLSLSVI